MPATDLGRTPVLQAARARATSDASSTAAGKMTSLLERPALLLSLFLAIGLGLGGTLIHLTSPPPAKHARYGRPPAHLQCGYAVSQWLEDHDQD